MTKIKICGLKRIEDIEAVNVFLPDYAGFVFAESKRKISPDFAAESLKLLDARIESVGVFKNDEPERIYEIVTKCNLDIIQLHGSENEEFLGKLKKLLVKNIKRYEIWKALPVDDKIQKARYYENIPDRYLLDYMSREVFGGSGKSFDFSLLKGFKGTKNCIAAGGINIENVEKLIIGYEPYAVDVSSGVETEGMKDRNKIKTFIEKVRTVDRRKARDIGYAI